jgi:hypothetical protein
MRGFRKGSKPFRKYLDRMTDNGIKLKQKTTIKTFFRLINILNSLNSRVSHFNANINRNCTFCRNTNAVPCPDETFLHLFFECDSTKSVLNRVKALLIPELINLGPEVEQKFWFTGTNFVSNKIDNVFLELVSGATMYAIWQCKLVKTNPTILKIINDLDHLINNAQALNQKIRIDMTLNLHICRNWDNIVSGRQ